MSEVAPIYEGTLENFDTLVLENSRKGPVLVNFWADWAGPCHRLFPILSGLARSYGGRFLLVNVNTDANKALAERLGVKDLPLMKVFRGGDVVETLHGYHPEQEMRRVIDRYVSRESDQRLVEALKLYKDGQVDEGLSLLAQAALDDPDNLRIPVTLGKLLMARGRFDEAHRLLAGLSRELRQQAEIGRLLAHLEFIREARQAPPMETLEARLGSNPDDSLARYQLSAARLVANDYAGALENLLELLSRDRGFRDDAGRRGMLAVFDLLGNQGPLVEDYRARMFSLLH